LDGNFFSEELSKLIRVNNEDVDTAWQIFRSHRDKAWSFTDCVSYAVMKRLNINEAFAFHEHFRQFGFVNVLP
jgi:predicted nucleic acid-binding protein